MPASSSLRPCSSDDGVARRPISASSRTSKARGPSRGPSSDGEWSGDDDPLSDHGREDEDEEEDEAVRRGRVRPHTVVPSSNGLELDDGRHKSLAEKGWARRAVVVRGMGPYGGADLEELPGKGIRPTRTRECGRAKKRIFVSKKKTITITCRYFSVRHIAFYPADF